MRRPFLQYTPLRPRKTLPPLEQLITSGRPERIELSSPAPQTGALPLSYGRHLGSGLEETTITSHIIMVNEKMAIVTKPCEIFDTVIRPVPILVMHGEDPCIGRATNLTHALPSGSAEHTAIRSAAMPPIRVLLSNIQLVAPQSLASLAAEKLATFRLF